ncbi:unnamed protein product [Ascophyllum nodosum]
MTQSAMDTDAMLDMSLDTLISKSKTGGRGSSGGGGGGSGRGGGRGGRGGRGGGGGGRGGGGGKTRITGRAARRQQSLPYVRESPSQRPFSSADSRLYVGNLAWEVSWKELKDCMAQAGRVLRADVAMDPVTGRSKVIDYVQFMTVSDAQAAIKTLQDFDLMGRPIYLREDRLAPQATPSMPGPMGRRGGTNCKVFVSNLAYECDWRSLKDHMRNAGNVLHADVFVGSDGRSRGLGTVEFSQPYEARNAIGQLTDSDLMGRPILVREYVADGNGNSGSFGRGVGGGAGARVFVGNLAWGVQWQDLKDYMRQAGNVKYVDLFQEAGGRSKGCAVVEYETPQEAHAAIRNLHDTELKGRTMFIREDREEGSAASKSMGPMGSRHPGTEDRQVYVGNLSWESGWQDLKDHFRQVGSVQFVEIPEDVQGRSKGYATVRFASEQGAHRAIDELNDTELGGRRIYVREDQQL